MGTSLTGLTPATTYDALIKVGDNGPLSSTAKVLSDGLGNDSPLAMSTTLVGIGTASPSANLEVSRSTQQTDFANASQVLSLINTSTDIANNATGIRLRQDNGTNNCNAFIGTLSSGNIANRSSMVFAPSNSSGDATERMRITSAGNVGIGTSTPDNTLDLGSPSQGRGLTFDNYSNLFSSYSAGDLVLSNNFYGSTSSDTYLTSLTATFGAAGMRISATSGASTGGQIQFFANAAAAKTAGTAFTPTEICRVTPNGLTFNGDTAAANALDDYEEGTFTATMVGGTFTTAPSGFYTKIGNRVFFTICTLGNTISGASGAAALTGLPFTSANVNFNYGVVSFSYTTAFTTTNVSGYIEKNSGTIYFTQDDGSTDANFLNGTGNRNFMLSGFYNV